MYTRVLQVCVWFGGGKQLAARLMPRKQPTFVLAKSGAKLPTTPREKSKLARWYCFLVIQHARFENNFHWKSSSNTDVFIMILVVAMFDCRRVHIANFFWFLLKGCWLYPCFASQSVGLTSWTFTSLSLQESNPNSVHVFHVCVAHYSSVLELWDYCVWWGLYCEVTTYSWSPWCMVNMGVIPHGIIFQTC